MMLREEKMLNEYKAFLESKTEELIEKINKAGYTDEGRDYMRELRLNNSKLWRLEEVQEDFLGWLSEYYLTKKKCITPPS